MRVAVPRETTPGERRVALVPETVSKLRDASFEIRVERGAGDEAGFDDAEYEQAGAEVVDGGDLLTGAAAVVAVGKPSPERIAAMAPGTVLIGFLQPLTDEAGLERLRGQGVVGFAMESIPRITRAQSMDALSS